MSAAEPGGGTRPDPPSPCVAVCIFDARVGRCAGCLRTMEEIQEWDGASTDRKYDILAALAERRAADS